MTDSYYGPHAYDEHGLPDQQRQTIHAATNKNEQFNGFAKWSFFGGSGIIAANLRHEQQKVVKYNLPLFPPNRLSVRILGYHFCAWT